MYQWVIILNKTNLPEEVPYFCMRCAQRLFHINRDILVAYQGDTYPAKEIPRGMGMVQHKCHRCKTLYTFYFQ